MRDFLTDAVQLPDGDYLRPVWDADDGDVAEAAGAAEVRRFSTKQRGPGKGKRKATQSWTADEEEALRQGIKKCVLPRRLSCGDITPQLGAHQGDGGHARAQVQAGQLDGDLQRVQARVPWAQSARPEGEGASAAVSSSSRHSRGFVQGEGTGMWSAWVVGGCTLV
jgi:hypothetical protein